MQLSLELLEALLRRASGAARDLGAGWTVHARTRLSDQRLRLGNRSLDVASELGSGVGRGAGRVLRLLPALERVVEGEAIVASSDGFVGLCQSRGRRWTVLPSGENFAGI